MRQAESQHPNPIICPLVKDCTNIKNICFFFLPISNSEEPQKRNESCRLRCSAKTIPRRTSGRREGSEDPAAKESAALPRVQEAAAPKKIKERHMVLVMQRLSRLYESFCRRTRQARQRMDVHEEISFLYITQTSQMNNLL